MPTQGPLATGRSGPPKVAVGTKRDRPRRFKGLGAYINQLDRAQRVLAGMDDSAEGARGAVKAEIARIEADIEAAKLWHDQQAEAARKFVDEIETQKIKDAGLGRLLK